MGYWEPTELDIKWAEQEASEYLYMNDIGKGLVTPEEYKQMHQASVNCLLFALHRLTIHVRQKPTWYTDDLAYTIPVELS